MSFVTAKKSVESCGVPCLGFTKPFIENICRWLISEIKTTRPCHRERDSLEFTWQHDILWHAIL
jgi:hypothetical protein